MQPFETDFCHNLSEPDPEQRSAKDPFAPWVSSRTPGILKGTHHKTGQVKWMVRFHSGPRTRTSRTFATLDEAKRFRNEQQERAQAMKDGRRVMPPPKQSTPFGVWAAENVVAVRANPRTAKAYQVRLDSIGRADPEFLTLPVGMIQRVDLERLRTRLLRYPYKANSVNAIVAFAKGVLNSAVENGHIAPHSIKLTPLPRTPSPGAPSHDELLAIVAAARPWYQGLIAATAILGLRSGEVRGLTVKAVDGLAHSLREGWVYSPDPFTWEVRIHRQLLSDGVTLSDVKGSKHREVYPDEAAMQVIVDQLNNYGPTSDGLIFQRFTRAGRPTGEGLTADAMNWLVQSAAMRGTGKAFTSHTLRRFHVTRRLRVGEQVRQVSDDVGHSSTEITQRIYNDLRRRERERGAAFADVAGAVGSTVERAAVVPHRSAQGS